MSITTTRTARIELRPLVVARIGDQLQTLADARENLDACAQLAAPDGSRCWWTSVARGR